MLDLQGLLIARLQTTELIRGKNDVVIGTVRIGFGNLIRRNLAVLGATLPLLNLRAALPVYLMQQALAADDYGGIGFHGNGQISDR